MNSTHTVSIHQQALGLGEMLQQRDVDTGILYLAGGDGAGDPAGDAVQQFPALAFKGIAPSFEIRGSALGQPLVQPLRIIFAPGLEYIGGTNCGSGHRRLGHEILIGQIAIVLDDADGKVWKYK